MGRTIRILSVNCISLSCRLLSQHFRRAAFPLACSAAYNCKQQRFSTFELPGGTQFLVA
jgi:hypothetical protein